MGINIGSIESDVTTILTSSIKDGSTANALVNYNANTMNLSVFLTYGNNESTLLHKIVNLMDVLPDTVVVGFSAATGLEAETHIILSWEFHSSLGGTSNSRIGVIIGSVVCACVVVFVAVLGGTSFLVWKYKIQKKRSTGDDVDMSIEFAKGTGPKRFSYRELRSATNGFDNAGKLGEGGFGEVYNGVLRDSSVTEVAIKRVSKGKLFDD
ncbi:L-type lectin-domain containing receptor kinase IX.2 [Acorus gramineus]|uniref:L-type lectin-domain containing receptor kinase IX.2 n=1 Tax=Acorus gramineus TaxID=55184 RepID=A0AAV9AYU9_ACOGR|nr:L-type lectin-domain containing receptor kinase IX.2 [Acorus gramineus]